MRKSLRRAGPPRGEPRTESPSEAAELLARNQSRMASITCRSGHGRRGGNRLYASLTQCTRSSFESSDHLYSTVPLHAL